MTEKTRLALKILISVIALVLAFRNTSLSGLAEVGVNTHWLLLALAVVASIVSVTGLGIRWQRIAELTGTAPLKTFITGQYIGLFGNNVFPLRAGEFMRADFVRKRLGKGFLTVAATIFFERLLDLSMAALAVGILIATTSMSLLPIGSGLYLAIGAVVIAAVIMVVVHNRERIVGFIRVRFPNSADGQGWLADLLTYRSIALCLGLSLMVWTLYGIRFQLVLLGIGLPADPVLVLLLLAATAAGFMIPAAPGAIGTYHVAVVFSMHNLYGIDLITAQAAAILLHLSAWLPSTVIGFVLFLSNDGRNRDADTGTEELKGG